VQRLGRNIGGYRGDPIDIAAVLEDVAGAARGFGWTFEPMPASPGFELHAWSRVQAPARHRPRSRVYISTGIHGDEPAGPLAVRELLQEDRWPEHVDLWVCPCLNPTGFPLNRRENSAGTDLNRQYLHLEAAETRAHVAWPQRQPAFDLTPRLHEDWESVGFYLYELNLSEQPSQGEEIVRRVSTVCPIDLSPEIEGRQASRGVIRPSADPRSRPKWPEAFLSLTHKTRHSLTREPPSSFPMNTRVSALVTAVQTALPRHVCFELAANRTR